MNSCVWAWVIHCPLLCLHPFPSRAAPLYCPSSLLRDDHCKLHKRFGCGEVRSTDCSDAHSEFCKWHLPGKNTAASISSRFPSTYMELTPPLQNLPPLSECWLSSAASAINLLPLSSQEAQAYPLLEDAGQGWREEVDSIFFFPWKFQFSSRNKHDKVSWLRWSPHWEQAEAGTRNQKSLLPITDYLSKPGNTDFPDWRHLPKQVCDSYSADISSRSSCITDFS